MAGGGATNMPPRNPRVLADFEDPTARGDSEIQQSGHMGPGIRVSDAHEGLGLL